MLGVKNEETVSLVSKEKGGCWSLSVWIEMQMGSLHSGEKSLGWDTMAGTDIMSHSGDKGHSNKDDSYTVGGGADVWATEHRWLCARAGVKSC